MKSAILLPALAGCLAVPHGRPPLPRAVDALDRFAFEEAHQRDDAAARAFSDVQIRSASGRCLTVDLLAGDFRANLIPIALTPCGSSDGQGWDVVTAGIHNDRPGTALLVNTLSGGCVSFDARRAPGDQVTVFSCGGRADGSGEVTDSQLFAFAVDDRPAGPLRLAPENAPGRCLTAAAAAGDRIDIASACDGDDTLFTVVGSSGNDSDDDSDDDDDDDDGGDDDDDNPIDLPADAIPTEPQDGRPQEPATTAAPVDPSGVPTSNPTTPVSVSRAGGTLDPSAAAEAHQVHPGDTRAFESVRVVAPDGQCLSVDPTAGDFRQNLIPVAVSECRGVPNEEWDLITAGVHNNSPPGNALLVSSLTGGCISFDGRRPAGDRVTVFSCGGRAAGEGETNADQLFPFADGQTEIVLAPTGSGNQTCLVPVNGRLDGTACADDGSQAFRIEAV